MPRDKCWLAALGLSLAALSAPAGAEGFAAGAVYWAPGSCVATCGLFDVTLGGDQQGASPIAPIQRSPGQVAWEASRAFAYITQFDLDSVVRIDASGAAVTFATGIEGATGLLVKDDGGILAVSFYDGAVYDISAGGDFTSAVPFASGFLGPRNLLELSTGEILLADQSRRSVFDITGGGDFSSAAAFASGFPFGPFDLVQDGAGRIYASTDGGVFEITGGGNLSTATPHATGRLFAGLAVDAEGRLLASDLDSGEVFDITAPGDYADAGPFAWNLDGFGDSALDTVPGATAAPPPVTVPALDGAGCGLLAGLLAAAGAAGQLSRAALRASGQLRRN